MAPKSKTIPHLYLVTDRQQTAGRSLQDVVSSAARGGVGMVQLREKDLTARDLLTLATPLKTVLDAHQIPLLINDRIDVALALDAAGVHLAGHSLPVAQARNILGPDKLIGVSTHSLEHALEAENEGADFIVFGPVFTTPSKVAYGPPQGLERLTDIIRRVTIPVIAIGGITMTNIPAVLATGAYGVAMIRAILEAEDPLLATQNLNAELGMRHAE